MTSDATGRLSGLMAGRRGLIMGVANHNSIAWAIARKLDEAGADLAFTYQGDAFRRRVEPLAASVDSTLVMPCDVEDTASLDAVFDRLGERWGGIDFVVHAIAYSDKEELKGRYLDTTLKNFLRTMHISCYSFTAVAQRAARLMPKGGALLTLSYLGAERVMPNYNVMGVAKSALEASVRYLAADLGPQQIRVNAVSAGPMRTLAGSAIADARSVYKFNELHSPLRRNITQDDVGGASMFLLSDLASGITGEVHFVDAGFHAVGMPAAAKLADALPSESVE